MFNGAESRRRHVQLTRKVDDGESAYSTALAYPLAKHPNGARDSGRRLMMMASHWHIIA